MVKYQEQEVIIEGTPAMFASMIEGWDSRLFRSGLLEKLGYLTIGNGAVFQVHVEKHWPPFTVPTDAPSVAIRVHPPRYEEGQTGQLPEGHINRMGQIVATALPDNRSQLIFIYPETEPRITLPWSLLLEELRRLRYLPEYKAEPNKPGARPPVPIDALKLSIMCQANTTARHLATEIKTCGNRTAEWIAHDCKDWPPRECTHYVLHPVDLEAPAQDMAAVLSSIVETKPKEGEPRYSTGIRFRLQEISSSPARTKLTILLCLVGSQIIRELGNTLRRLFNDLPEAAKTVTYFAHFWPEEELPEHLENPYNEFTAWLKSKGGKEVDPLIELWGYDHEVETLERQAIYGQDTQARDDQGEHPCKISFYLDDTTARNAATWLATNWNESHKPKPGIWTFPSQYQMTRAYQLLPLAEKIDDRGRYLLTVGIDERTAGGWQRPFSVSDAGTTKARAIEMLVIPAGNNAAQVFAGCNAFILLEDFTNLVWQAKQLFGARMYHVNTTFGIMDTPLPEDDPVAREHFAAQMTRFQAMVAEIEPALAYLKPESEAIANGEPARDNEPEIDPDNIPRWGRRRDLSTNEVRGIIKRCKQYQEANGSIAKFHEQESRQWPDPEDSPKSYSLKTLQKWMTQERFQR